MKFWDEHRHEWFKPLECDACGAVFGWVYELDLNGSLFVCHACRTQAMPVEEKNVDQWAREQNPDPTVTPGVCRESSLFAFGAHSLNSDKTVTVADGDTSKSF